MKQSFKKAVSTVMASLLALSLALVPATVSAADSFSDTKGHWAQEAVDKWNANGVVKGFEGAFRPNDPVTRAEFATMIDNIMNYVATGDNSFSDISASKWYYDALNKLNTAGVYNGSEGKAYPDRLITRQEASVLVAKAFKLGKPDTASSFKDQASIASWAKDSVAALAARNAIKGAPDGSFKPLDNLTRAEAVTIFDNFIQEFISAPGEYSKQNVDGNVVVNTPGVVLNNMAISGDLYIAEGVGEGEVTLNDVVVQGSVVVAGGGEHSIIFNNVDVKGALVVNKYNGKVRILATGSTSVSVTRLESGALLVTKELTGGGFETVEISADVLEGQEIVLDGTFQKVTNNSGSASITVNGTIKELITNVDTKIKGDALIEKVTSQNGTTATVNDKPADGGTNEGTNGGTAGGSTGSDPGGGSGPGVSNVAVTSVSIDSSDLNLVIGETKQLTATIAPSNATNKSVTWTVYGNSDAIAVSESGLLTAKAEGKGTVRVTTADGNKTNEITVKVSKPALDVGLASWTGELVDSEAGADQAVLANSVMLSVYSFEEAIFEPNHYFAVVKASDKLQATATPDGHYANLVLSLLNDGTPIADASGIQASVSVSGSVYEPSFGAGIAGSGKAGSVLIPFDAGSPEEIRTIDVALTSDAYADTKVTIYFVPAGENYIKSVGPIDELLGAENALYVREPVLNMTGYGGYLVQWLRSDSADGVYSVIDGANSLTYTLQPEDSEEYLKVMVFGDQMRLGGFATSEAFGPIEKLIDPDEVFSALEDAILQGNSSLGSIVSDLNLVTSLPEYPGVSVSWTSDKPAVVSNEGVIARDEKDDQIVHLTAVLGGKTTGSKIFELIVRKQGTDNVGTGDYIDSYFADNYPQAYVNNGTIWVRYELNAPADVYMVVNSINGHLDADVTSVLEGHTGTSSDAIWVNEWPFFRITQDQVGLLQEFDTGVALNDKRDAKVEFVIRDEGKNYTSSEVTRIIFDAESLSALDSNPPYTYTAYVNDSLSSIYLYFYEKLDESSIPSSADFTLTDGQVTNVTIVNDSSEYAFAAAYIKLDVSGITADDLTELAVSYSGDKVQDMSDAHNKLGAINKLEVSSINDRIESATISSDRLAMIVNIVPGWNPNENGSNYGDVSRFTVKVGDQSYTPSTANFSYSFSDLSYRLKFDSPLPAGKVSVIFNTAGIINWAKDPYPEQLTTSDVKEIAAPGTPIATYSDGKLTLTFSAGYEINNSSYIASGITLNVDGREYSLRGFILERDYQDASKNTAIVDLNDTYAKIVREAVDAGSSIKIKYTKVNGISTGQISDTAGALLPDFDYVTVTKQGS